MCRACNVTFENSCNPYHKCKFISGNKFIKWSKIVLNQEKEYTETERATALESLHRRSFHAVDNAFNDVDFAGFPRGVFGCTPHDLMHLFLEGVLKYCTRLFMSRYSSSQKAVIDQLVTKMFDKFHSSEKKNYPRYCFIKGMTNLTMITADEEIGMAMLFVILGQTDDGKIALDVGLEQVEANDAAPILDDISIDDSSSSEFQNAQLQSTDPDDSSTVASFYSYRNEDDTLDSKCTFENVIQVLEMLLCFHAWY